MASLTELARLAASSFTRLAGNAPLHGSIGVPLDDDSRRAELAGEFSDLLDDEACIGIIELHHARTPSMVLTTSLVQIPGVRVKVDDHRLGEDLFAFRLNAARGGGRELHVVLILLVGVLGLTTQLPG